MTRITQVNLIQRAPRKAGKALIAPAAAASSQVTSPCWLERAPQWHHITLG